MFYSHNSSTGPFKRLTWRLEFNDNSTDSLSPRRRRGACLHYHRLVRARPGSVRAIIFGRARLFIGRMTPGCRLHRQNRYGCGCTAGPNRAVTGFISLVFTAVTSRRGTRQALQGTWGVQTPSPRWIPPFRVPYRQTAFRLTLLQHWALPRGQRLPSALNCIYRRTRLGFDWRPLGGRWRVD